MSELPFYLVRRLSDGRWCVAHRVPGAGVDAIDVECQTLKAAWTLACDWNEQREAMYRLEIAPNNQYKVAASL